MRDLREPHGIGRHARAGGGKWRLRTRSTGPDISADEILAAAARHFGFAGIDPTSGTLTVVAGASGQAWFVTLDRTIDGFPVANHPMWWGIAGETYVAPRSDGSLVDLYAIRPEPTPLAPPVPTDVLADRLASVIERSGSEIDELEPSFM